ncbi:IPT/TIG domain-containing protein [Cyanobacteria bacterium FACHB-63]|nr:IPT/TIG domain-containing protein [Cyanobacteria bacterium FACHB-63]
MSDFEDGLPIEEFIQALTSQLDRAQATMGLKARFGLPLTFAVKDISIDLRAQVEMVKSQIRIRPAGANEDNASILHFAFTTITRPMIEENTVQMQADEPSLKEVLGDEITDEEQRRLEWAGIRSVSQLKELQNQKSEHVIEQVAQIPALRLRAALERASRPHVSRVVSEGADRLRIRGLNLKQDQDPSVRIGGEPVTVLEANDRELLVAPLSHQMSGALEVETAPGIIATTELNPPSEQLNVSSDPYALAPDSQGGGA